MSIITLTRCPYSYMYCIDMLRWACMVGIVFLSHAMWSRNTIFMSGMIMSTTRFLFNIALGWFMIHSKIMGCHLQNIGFGQMGVQGSSNQNAHFIGWVVFTKRQVFNTPRAFLKNRHRKGEHDGAGACMKWALWRYQMSHSASRLKCLAEVVDWCTQNLGHQGHEQARPLRR